MAAKTAKKKTASKKTAPAKAVKKIAAKKKAARKPASRKSAATFRLSAAAPNFTVNDIDRSLAWYQDVLGCVINERWEHNGKLMGAELLAGGVTFYLGQDDWKKGRDRKKGEGFRIYCTAARKDIDALAAGIKARGGTLDQEPQDQSWGGRDFSLTDPDGFKITIASER